MKLLLHRMRCLAALLAGATGMRNVPILRPAAASPALHRSAQAAEYHTAPDTWRGCDHGDSPSDQVDCRAAAAELFDYSGGVSVVADKALPRGCVFNEATASLALNSQGSHLGFVEAGTWRLLCPGPAGIVKVSLVATDALWLTEYSFGPSITPRQGDMAVHSSTIFVGWWRGGMENRSLMLSRRAIDGGVWEHAEFPHQHQMDRGDVTKGDSHNNVAVGVSPKDGTIHLLFDMHGLSPEDSPSGYFNYICSERGAASMEGQWGSNRFFPKRAFLRPKWMGWENYGKVTYPDFFTMPDGRLVASFRRGGSLGALRRLAAYDGEQDSWDPAIGAIWGPNIEWNDRDGSSRFFGEQGFYGRFRVTEGGSAYACWQRRTAAYRAAGWPTGHGLYAAVALGDPLDQHGTWAWTNASGTVSSVLPISSWAPFKVAEPAPDPTNLMSVPACALADSGAFHAVVDVATSGQMSKHVFRSSNTSAMTIVEVDADRPQLHIHAGRVFLVSLDKYGRPIISWALVGTNDWQLLLHVQGGPRFNHYSLLADQSTLLFFGMVQTTEATARSSTREVYMMRFYL